MTIQITFPKSLPEADDAALRCVGRGQIVSESFRKAQRGGGTAGGSRRDAEPSSSFNSAAHGTCRTPNNPLDRILLGNAAIGGGFWTKAATDLLVVPQFGYLKVQIQGAVFSNVPALLTDLVTTRPCICSLFVNCFPAKPSMTLVPHACESGLMHT